MNYPLTNEGIDLACQELENYMTAQGIEHRLQLRTRLSFELVLLQYQERFGRETYVELICGKRFRRLQLRLILRGDRYEPFTAQGGNSNELNELLDRFSVLQGMAPGYQYVHGQNVVTYSPERRPRLSSTMQIVLAILLAVLAGVLSMQLPAAARTAVSDDFLSPLFSLITGLISGIAAPLIFLSVALSICTIGDMETLNRIGKGLLWRFLSGLLLTALPVCVICFPAFAGSGSQGGDFSFGELFSLLLDIIPTNIFQPFVNGNTLQLIVLAAAAGIAMIILASHTQQLLTGAEQILCLLQYWMSASCALVPLIVFISIYNLIIQNKLAAAFSAWKLVLIFCICALLTTAGNLVLTGLRLHMSPLAFLHKISDPVLTAFTTASSVASMDSNQKALKENLGIEKLLADFGLPLGQILYRPGSLIRNLCFAFGFASMYGVSISPGWAVTAVLICLLCTIAAPPIPGGSLSIFLIIFTQLGIPEEAVGLAATLNAVMDFPITGENILSLSCQIAGFAGSVNMMHPER